MERLPQKINFQFRQTAAVLNDVGKAFQQPFNITGIIDMLIDVEIPVPDTEPFFNLGYFQYGQLSERVFQHMFSVHGIKLPGKGCGPDRATVCCIDNDPGADAGSNTAAVLVEIKIS